MMGYLCLCPPAVCRPSALTYSCSTGQIGALMAESFCERILSCAKQVVHRHRLKSVNAEEYSMVVILRMNRAFIGVHAQAREGL